MNTDHRGFHAGGAALFEAVGVGTLVAGGLGYLVGSLGAETVYDLAVEPHKLNE